MGSKTVGLEVGRQETPANLLRVQARRWQQVWSNDYVRAKELLILPVAVDDRRCPEDWVCVVVRSCNKGEKLGDAERLCVGVHDPAKRVSVQRRIARNIDALVRGVGAYLGSQEPDVEFLDVPRCDVGSQRLLCSFGLVMRYVCELSAVPFLYSSSEVFPSDVSNVLRALFAQFRQNVSETGYCDVEHVLSDRGACLRVLRSCGQVPSLVVRSPPGPSVSKRQELARADVKKILRVATWNIAGGHKSAKSPSNYKLEDQRAVLMAEILRLEQSFGIDILALQECENEAAYEELTHRFVHVGAAEAKDSRGFVHVYVRHGVNCDTVEMRADTPGVCVMVSLDESRRETVIVAAVHLPVGDSAGMRKKILGNVLQSVTTAERCGCQSKARVLLIGDMNANKDDEVATTCDELKLKESRYAGSSWGTKDNRFYGDSEYGGPGLKKDRVLFGTEIWAETHLIGQRRRFFEGAEFCLSDHFGLLIYVDASNMYPSRSKADVLAARIRRAQLVSLRDESQQKESVEVKAARQEGREGKAMQLQRVAECDRAAFQKRQMRGARARQRRRVELRESAFGARSLFAVAVQASPALAQGIPSAPCEIAIRCTNEIHGGTWASTKDLPLRGMHNTGNMCYVNTLAQILLRTPAVFEWLRAHHRTHCRSCSKVNCVLCALSKTSEALFDGECTRGYSELARKRACIGEQFASSRQQCVVEFFERLCVTLREQECASMRCGHWEHIENADKLQVATHVDRVFGFVLEKRGQCATCQAGVRSWFACARVLRLHPIEKQGGPMTVSELYLNSCQVLNEEFECAECKNGKAIHSC